MTKKATTRPGAGEASADETAPTARRVKYVVNRPYSAGEPHDIVDAEVVHEYEGEEDLLRLKLINPPTDAEEDQKRVRRSDRQEPGTWFEAPASAAPAEQPAPVEMATTAPVEEVANGDRS